MSFVDGLHNTAKAVGNGAGKVFHTATMPVKAAAIGTLASGFGIAGYSRSKMNKALGGLEEGLFHSLVDFFSMSPLENQFTMMYHRHVDKCGAVVDAGMNHGGHADGAMDFC